jgi:hypothetical protein
MFVLTAVGYLGSFVVYTSVVRESRLVAPLAVLQLIYLVRLSLTVLRVAADRGREIVELVR